VNTWHMSIGHSMFEGVFEIFSVLEIEYDEFQDSGKSQDD